MGGVFPDPGESRQRLRCRRELHPVLTRKHARHAMQTDRPVVIAHAAPGNDDISQGGRARLARVGKRRRNTGYNCQNPSRLRLLKHDLGKKNPVLIGNAPQEMSGRPGHTTAGCVQRSYVSGCACPCLRRISSASRFPSRKSSCIRFGRGSQRILSNARFFISPVKAVTRK